MLTKPELAQKPLAEWSAEERAAAQEMAHTVALNYLLVRRLAQLGDKYDTFEEIVAGLLEQEQEQEQEQVAH